MKTFLPILAMALLGITLVQCTASKSSQTGNAAVLDSSLGLKDHFAKYFTMGVAVAPRSIKGDEAALILKHFGGITPENAMKMGPIHPRENEYFWRDADSIMAFAKNNNLKVRGHNLCWHNQAPRWMFTNEKGDTVSKAVLLQRLKDHITTVVNRYKGQIYAWDVVNEAISDKTDEYLRPSVWYRICGEEFIAKAFEYAHAADPNALLFYNDYNEINPVKREKIYRLVKSLKDAGVPIHGVGLQAHWAINEPSEEELENTLSKSPASASRCRSPNLIFPSITRSTTRANANPKMPSLISQRIKKRNRSRCIPVASRPLKNTGKTSPALPSGISPTAAAGSIISP
jgi:endo-1,4-beta-xylanase